MAKYRVRWSREFWADFEAVSDEEAEKMADALPDEDWDAADDMYEIELIENEGNDENSGPTGDQ